MKVGTEDRPSTGSRRCGSAIPTRPMTVQDLLRHTAGLTYGTRGTALVHKAWMRTGEVEEARLCDLSLSQSLRH